MDESITRQQEAMKTTTSTRCVGRLLAGGLAVGSALMLAACGGGSSPGSIGQAAPATATAAKALVATAAVSTEDDADGRSFRTVPKASCGEEDNPETALQGQVPAALRASGFGGFSCNLKLIGQVRGDGANWQSAEFKDRVHKCAYHGTSYSTVNRTQLGVPVIDVTHADRPTVAAIKVRSWSSDIPSSGIYRSRRWIPSKYIGFPERLSALTFILALHLKELKLNRMWRWNMVLRRL